MIIFPCAKINLGLNVVGKRPDGYHNLETVFYPVPLTDALEIKLMDERYPTVDRCDLHVSGCRIEGNEADNLVVKAYNMVAESFDIPRVHIHLHKGIPMQAGLGGGSSDAAYMIRMLDERFRLNMGISEMERMAAKLGADCAFFITSEPAYATGIGDQLRPIASESDCHHYLRGKWIAIIKPSVAVSTKEAYAGIRPKQPAKCCRDIVMQPIETWKNELVNDFEDSIFTSHPELPAIKQKLYDKGALYAAMSGSGSSIFGIFEHKPEDINFLFPNCKNYVLEL